MRASRELRQKLVLLIGNLICRCIEEARHVPYILRQEEVLELLFRNPTKFQKLIEEERLDRTEYSTGTLTAKLDALEDLGQFESLDAYNLSLSGCDLSEHDISPALERVNRLTRTFAVYIGNTVTVFEREFELFTEKFCRLLDGSGMALKAVQFTAEDMPELEARAGAYLASRKLFHAFVFERLLSCHIITKKVVLLPAGYSLGEKMIRDAINDPDLFSRVVQFILRASYVSQGGWEDLFTLLVRIVEGEPDASYRLAVIEMIEQDAIFSCNLLCLTFAELKEQSDFDRWAAIDKALKERSRNAGPA